MRFLSDFSRISRFLIVFFQCLLEDAPDKGRTILPINYLQLPEGSDLSRSAAVHLELEDIFERC